MNITDIRDESDYIESIGKKAASEAINRAMVEVAEQDKLGAIGQAQANREKEIKVKENEAESSKVEKKQRRMSEFCSAARDYRLHRRAEADRERAIRVAENQAEAVKDELPKPTNVFLLSRKRRKLWQGRMTPRHRLPNPTLS